LLSFHIWRRPLRGNFEAKHDQLRGKITRLLIAG
jgi:hypothetical protein